MLKGYLRRSDILARFGGDEFIVALPETDLRQASVVMEKLRLLTISGPWMYHPQLGPIRLSVGLGQMRMDESPQETIQRADVDLYASRQNREEPLAPSTHTA